MGRGARGGEGPKGPNKGGGHGGGTCSPHPRGCVLMGASSIGGSAPGRLCRKREALDPGSPWPSQTHTHHHGGHHHQRGEARAQKPAGRKEGEESGRAYHWGGAGVPFSPRREAWGTSRGRRDLARCGVMQCRRRGHFGKTRRPVPETRHSGKRLSTRSMVWHGRHGPLATDWKRGVARPSLWFDGEDGFLASDGNGATHAAHSLRGHENHATATTPNPRHQAMPRRRVATPRAPRARAFGSKSPFSHPPHPLVPSPGHIKKKSLQPQAFFRGGQGPMAVPRGGKGGDGRWPTPPKKKGVVAWPIGCERVRKGCPHMEAAFSRKEGKRALGWGGAPPFSWGACRHKKRDPCVPVGAVGGCVGSVLGD